MSPISPDSGFAIDKPFTCSQVSIMIAPVGIGSVYFETDMVAALVAAKDTSKNL